MKTIFAIAAATLLAAACSNVGENSQCDLTNLGVKIGSWPNEAAKAKATEHFNLAKAAREKKDFPACQQHAKQAEDALKM